MPIYLGETWNISKIGYQLKQVRERLAKGLVDKGVLRTEKRNFLLFDMATHPVQDMAAKRIVIQKCLDLVLARTPMISDDPAPDYQLRRILFVSCYAKADALIAEHNRWPMPEASWKDLENYIPKASLEVIAGVFSVYARMDSVL
ncbi:Golgi phosphoprotein 3-domain-containing protein [Syncephalis fuscata]|nr:Golgi phosphoprotein 3-domain-containing protein [Syncephalis fuscata]